jgi:uncharacterized membrane protein (UPF0127 family)
VKKHRTYIIVLIVGISIIIGWRYLYKRNDQRSENIIVKRDKSGPKFKEEGKLRFINQHNRDTLASIVIEVAETPEEIEKGLMYRNMLEANQGMLFLFNIEGQQSFWMKNTAIPLDIIFIDNNYQIVHIAKHTIPYSKDPILSMKPARYVLEVNAGFSDKHAIEESHIVHFIIDNSLSL